MADAAIAQVLSHYDGDAKLALLGFAEYAKTNQSFEEAQAAYDALAQILKVEVKKEEVGLMAMPLTVSPGATRAFEKWVEANAGKTAEEESTEVAMGKECVRNGCSNTYTGPASLEAVCSHHPGQAVFHETYKYWSCCERNKKYDFDEFRAIPGCRDGPETCAFSEASAGMAKKAPCRHDFFQVGPNLTLNIYAKKVDPSKSTFFVSDTQMFVTLFFDGKEFSLNLNLAGKVDPTQCKVEIKEPKVEISLKKGADGPAGVQGAAWETLGTPISA